MSPEDSRHTLARSHHHQRVTSQGGDVTSESGSKEKKMEVHWPHYKAGQNDRYKDGVRLETGGKKKEGETKDNVEKDRREADERRRMGFVRRGAGRCSRQSDMESFDAGPM